MKKAFISFLLVVMAAILIGCGSTTSSVNYGSSLRTENIGKMVTTSQKYSLKRPDFNSFCYSQNIPSNLTYWISADYRDYETGKAIRELVYTRNNSNTEGISSDVYRTRLNIAGTDTTFVVIYRKTVKK